MYLSSNQWQSATDQQVTHLQLNCNHSMNNTQEYNGWTNRETWNINLTYNEIFASMCEDQTFGDLECLADAFEMIVDELEFNDLKVGTLAHQAVGDYLNAVNWQELAETYAADFNLFVEDAEEQDIKGLKELLAEAELE